MARPGEERNADELVEELLRRQVAEAQPLGGSGCGDAELLAAYAEGALAGPSRQDFELHLAACTACREAVVRLVRLAPREAEPAPVRPQPAWRARWAWAAPALAGMALVGSLVWYNRGKIQEPPAMPIEVRRAQEAPPPKPQAEAPAEPALEDRLSKDRRADLRPPEKAPAAAAGSGAAANRAAATEEFAPAPPLARRPEADQAAPSGAPAAAASPAKPAPLMAQVPPAAQPESPAAEALPLQQRRDEAKKEAAAESALAERAKVAPGYQTGVVAGEPKVAGRAAAGAGLLRAVPQPSAATTSPKARMEKSAAQKPPAEGAVAQRLTVAGRHAWVLMADGRVFHSTDSGQTWRLVPVPELPQSLSFEDEKSGEMVGRSGERYLTTDGGKTWHAAKVRNR